MPDDADIESTIPELSEPPVEGKAIPEFLLQGMSPRDLHILKTIALTAEQVRWLCESHAMVHEHVRRLDRRLIRLELRQTRLERWQDIIASKWSIVVAIALLILAPLLTYLVRFLPKPK